jgi:hypothetical protein
VRPVPVGVPNRSAHDMWACASYTFQDRNKTVPLIEGANSQNSGEGSRWDCPAASMDETRERRGELTVGSDEKGDCAMYLWIPTPLMAPCAPMNIPEKWPRFRDCSATVSTVAKAARLQVRLQMRNRRIVSRLSMKCNGVTVRLRQ